LTATFGCKLYNTADFLLNQVNGILIQGINEDISSKINSVNIPRRHGGKIDDTQFLNPRIISIEGLIIGTSKENYRDNIATFLKNIKFGKQKFYKFDDRYIWVNNGSLQVRDISTLMAGNFSLDLICVDPFWYNLTESNNDFTTASTSYGFSVTTLGNVITPARISIMAATNFTNPTITNSTLLQTATYTGVSTALIEDTANLTVTSGGSNVLSNFSGEFINLGVGLNNLIFTQSASVSVTIRVYWTNRYY